MRYMTGFRCIGCAREIDPAPGLYQCPFCSSNLEVICDYGSMDGKRVRSQIEKSGDFTARRYLPLLPMEADSPRPAVDVGWTPLYRTDGLGIEGLYIKDEGGNPSGSLKDRASFVALARAAGENADVVCCASTGNAASSLACLAAPMGMRTVVFVPESAPRAKVVQLLVYGAAVFAVRGTYDDAYDLSIEASKTFGWYCRNTGYNPFTREGKKTAAFEICEQLGWKSPDSVFVPVGDGNIISGVWKGFKDLHALGLIERLPALVACQASGSGAVYRAWKTGEKIAPFEGETVADSIKVTFPRDGDAALRAIHDSGGFAAAVDDGRILQSMGRMARNTGVFTEPSGAVTLAVFEEALERGLVREDDTVVLLATGSGLKDVESAITICGSPFTVEPALTDVKRLVSGGALERPDEN